MVRKVFGTQKNRENKGAKGFNGCHLKIDTAEVASGLAGLGSYRSLAGALPTGRGGGITAGSGVK
jgi:hypothetical protein